MAHLPSGPNAARPNGSTQRTPPHSGSGTPRAAPSPHVMPDLVIVESPGKTRKINQILGSGQIQQAASSRLKLVGVGHDGDRAEALRGGEDHLHALGCGDGRSRGPGRGAQLADGRVRRGAVPAEPPRYESKKGSQEAHEAIRPTDPAAGGLVAQEGEAVGREEGVVREGRCRPAAAVALRVVRRGAATLEGGPVATCTCARRGPRAGAWRSEAGRGAGPGVAAPAPDRRFGAVDSGGSTFAFGDCGWSPEMHRVFGKTLASANGTIVVHFSTVRILTPYEH